MQTLQSSSVSTRLRLLLTKIYATVPYGAVSASSPGAGVLLNSATAVVVAHHLLDMVQFAFKVFASALLHLIIS